jgi:hypothetical protein
VREADPAALLVPARILRRVIKRDRGLTFAGWSVTRRKSYVIAREPLRAIVAEDELVLWPESAWPRLAVLLLRPDPQDLAARPTDEVLLEYWRMLFHAQAERDVRNRFATGTINAAGLRRRIERIGPTSFEEIRSVLRQEGYLLPPRDNPEVYTEFAALYQELRAFSPALVAHVFPALEDPDAIDDLLVEDVDTAALLARSRLAGAPDPHALEAPAHGADSEALLAAAAAAARPPRRGARAARRLFRWLIVHAERSSARGNVVRAAIDRARAGLLVGPVLAVQAGVGARNELHRLVDRLQAALGLADADADEWRQALPPLLTPATHGFWTPEGRLLYDLQRVCLDHERTVFTVDLVEWVAAGCRKPLKRPLPHLREVLISNHLRSAAARLRAVRIAGAERARLAELLHHALRDAEEAVRERFRPLIVGVFCTTRILPHNVPETVAYHKLIEELLDRIVLRGFLSLGDLRDALSRSNLKLPDLSGPAEFFRGDRLLQTDTALALELEGVYRRGEIYLRWLQRASALAFATRPGRFLTRYAALPYGGAYIGLGGLQHLIELVVHPLTGHEVHLASWASVIALGTLASGLINSATFRHWFVTGLKFVGRGLKRLAVELPARLLRLPVIRTVLDSRFVLFLWRFLIKPLLVAVPIGLAGSAAGMPRSETTGAIAIVYIPAVVVLNSRVGRDVEEILAEQAVRLWRRLYLDVIPGLFRLIMTTFDQLLEVIDRLLYAVDEWLRFRSGQHPAALVLKAILGLGWAVVAYVVRASVNLLIEPQVNPIKHFPVVTVSHKLILPLSIPLTRLLRATLLGPRSAPLVAGAIVLATPGVFGFLVWELKENWKLYEANRGESLRPVLVGSHGETMVRLLRPGIHSGTVPKLFAKLRRAERGDAGHRDRPTTFKRLEALHHVEESIRRFVDRDFIALLAQSRTLRDAAIGAGLIHLATNRIRLELRMTGALAESEGERETERLSVSHSEADAEAEAAGRGLWIDLDYHHDALIAEVSGPAWLPRLTRAQIRVLDVALIGIFKMCGVEWVRVVPDPRARPHGGRPELAAAPVPGKSSRAEGEDEDDDSLERQRTSSTYPEREGNPAAPVLFPFAGVVVTWQRWVEAWKREASGAKHPTRFIEGYTILPWERG